jgi:hypothetical protein
VTGGDNFAPAADTDSNEEPNAAASAAKPVTGWDRAEPAETRSAISKDKAETVKYTSEVTADKPATDETGAAAGADKSTGGGHKVRPSEDRRTAGAVIAETSVAESAVSEGRSAVMGVNDTPVKSQIYYDEIRISPSPDDPRRFIFIANRNSPKELPDDLVALRHDYSETARVAAVLFANNIDERKEVFAVLHCSADRGLRGPNFSIKDGRENLEEVKEHITDLAHKIRDDRLSEYGWYAIFLGVLPLVIGFLIFQFDGFGYLPPPENNVYDRLFVCILTALWIPAGAAICVWGEFALRMQGGLSYEQLLNMDPSRWQPFQRLTITIGISFIFAFLLAFNAVQVGVGNLLLNDFAGKSPQLALAVGGVTGLTFVAVRDIVFRLRTGERG